MKEINSNQAPAAIGPYSQAIESNGMVFISGQLPIDSTTGEFKGDSIEEQATQSLDNIKAILKESGLDMSNVVKTVILLDNMNDFVKVNEVYAKYFEKPYPARASYEVSRLPKGALVEIEAIASK
jgi:2-iminobutanoate/2-iminopropanoate deaminase